MNANHTQRSLSERLDRQWLLNALKVSAAEKQLVWLHGPRGVGKTTLIRQLIAASVVYIDCESPGIEADLRAEESLSARLSGKTMVILDEVHAAANPAELIQTCLQRGVKVVATSSAISDLSTSLKSDQIAHHRLTCLRNDEFREGLAIPAIRRLLLGSLPQAHLTSGFPERVFRTWHDTVILRDLQWAYGSHFPQKLSRLLIYVLQHSGECFVTSRVAVELDLSRPKVTDYLEILARAGLIWFVYPYGSNVVERRRIYAFDTGLISWARGWRREEQADLELLWRHLVLGHLRSSYPEVTICYWNDPATKTSIDFILEDADKSIAVDCRWNTNEYSIKSFKHFNQHVRKELRRNYLVCSDPVHPAPAHMREHRIAQHTPDILKPVGSWQSPSAMTAPAIDEPIESADISQLSGRLLGRMSQGMTVKELVWLLEQCQAEVMVHIGIVMEESPSAIIPLDVGTVMLFKEGKAQASALLLDVDSAQILRDAPRGKNASCKTTEITFPRNRVK